MRHSNITANNPIENRPVLNKKIKDGKDHQSEKSKASISKPNGKSLPGDKTLGPDPAICFYETEDGDNNKEGEY